MCTRWCGHATDVVLQYSTVKVHIDSDNEVSAFVNNSGYICNNYDFFK
jgi:hypothetical protein